MSSSTQDDIIINTPGGYIYGRRGALGKVGLLDVAVE